MERIPGQDIKDGAFYSHLTEVVSLEVSPANRRHSLRAIRLLVRDDQTRFYKQNLKEHGPNIKRAIGYRREVGKSR